MTAGKDALLCAYKFLNWDDKRDGEPPNIVQWYAKGATFPIPLVWDETRWPEAVRILGMLPQRETTNTQWALYKWEEDGVMKLAVALVQAPEEKKQRKKDERNKTSNSGSGRSVRGAGSRV